MNTNMNNVDQIREIIFGSQMKDFEEKFTQLESVMEKSEERLMKHFESAHTSLQREIDRTLEALEKKVDNLTVTTQRDRQKLKELIDTTDETFMQQMMQHKDEFDNKMKLAKENNADEFQKLQETLETMKNELNSVMNGHVSQLANDKLSRDAMSQLLLDVAMKIQGSDANTLSAMMTQQAAPQTASPQPSSQPSQPNKGVKPGK